MSGRLILVTGGSGSGKSAFAERLLLGQAPGRAVYLATMERRGEEAEERVARHRAMRELHGTAVGRRFATLERPTDIGGAAVAVGDAVLLEDLGNLLSNEIWSPAGAGEGAEAAILSGIAALLERAALLVVVSNEIFSDGCAYDEGTLQYIRGLGRLHQALARRAEAVVEVVCGLPVWKKGGPPSART